jgi:hypothetical protein
MPETLEAQVKSLLSSQTDIIKVNHLIFLLNSCLIIIGNGLDRAKRQEF